MTSPAQPLAEYRRERAEFDDAADHRQHLPSTGVVGTTAQSFQYDGRDTVSTTNTDAAFTFDSISRVIEEAQSI